MNLKEKITKDLTDAMKAGQNARVSTLRMLKAAVMKFEVSGKEKSDATDDEVLQIIGKEVKQRRDSIDAYQKGGREDMAAQEKEEMEILQMYLPAQMDEAELRNLVTQVISQTGAQGKGDFGKVMGAVMAQTKGKAEGQVVSRLVGEILK